MNLSEARLTSREKAALRRRLLAWFHRQQRELPWRANRDPYAIWISEVMLQQTQVTTVIPFFQRFLQRFPTVATLAAADEQEVLKFWEGLGYYRRARHLHQAAQLMVRNHCGQFPRTVDEAQGLPGLGRYTLGAVLSQAYDLRLPVVDANVARVLCRLYAWEQELEQKQTQHWLWTTADDLLPAAKAGDFNQAWMELGQTICTPKQPSCLLCPLREYCRGYARGLEARLPRKRTRQRNEQLRERAIILRRGRQFLLCQRSSHASRWANMWELPSGAGEDSAREQCRTLTGYDCRETLSMGSLQYGITRYRVTLEVMEARYAGGRPHRRTYQKLEWIRPGQLANYPLSVPHRRVVRRWLDVE